MSDEADRADRLADHALVHGGPRRLGRAAEEGVRGGAKHAPGGDRRLDHPTALGHGGAHGLFHIDVLARLERGKAHLGVGDGRRDVHDHVHPGVVEEGVHGRVGTDRGGGGQLVGRLLVHVRAPERLQQREAGYTLYIALGNVAAADNTDPGWRRGTECHRLLPAWLGRVRAQAWGNSTKAKLCPSGAQLLTFIVPWPPKTDRSVSTGPPAGPIKRISTGRLGG